ncbi:MAG: hypothetical protein EAZ37_11585 [Burkholderiales bacterium]|nr:MAG: hypothetical protein EAZ37_11585 [Burkholderiales bacterium]
MFFDKNQHSTGMSIAGAAIKFIVISAGLAGCTPAFNWREVGFDQAGVTALLPCKPDRGTRAVQLAGQSAQMSMAGCESGGAMFTLSLVEAPTEQAVKSIAQDLKDGSKATHSRQLAHGRFIAQAAIYGNPKEGHDGPGAFSAQAVETFLSNLKMAGAK